MTLDPDQRTNFLNLLRLPSGYCLDDDAGTTYSMDFVALTAVLLAFVDAESKWIGITPWIEEQETVIALSNSAGKPRTFIGNSRLNGLF